MRSDLPDYFFRTRENGAIVFRVNTENRQRRIEMEQIAVVNIKNGEIKPHGGRPLGDADKQAIDDWVHRRKQQLEDRYVDDIFRAVDQLNGVSQWAQSKATDAQLEAITDALLLTMHDLRTVLVKKKADRLTAQNQAAE